jgi:hypothetical protein
MQVFKYEDRITLDYLRTLGIRPSQPHIHIMFPADAPRTNVSTVAQDPAATKTATVRRLGATDAARLCFVTNYLSQSERLVDVLYMPRLVDCTPRLQDFRAIGHLWDGDL